MPKNTNALGSKLNDGLGDDELMGPEHHEYCNVRFVGRECDCGLQALYIERKDLAMLIRKLVRVLNSTNPGTKAAAQAIDYLTRHKLHGCILRNDA